MAVTIRKASSSHVGQPMDSLDPCSLGSRYRTDVGSMKILGETTAANVLIVNRRRVLQT